LDINEIDESHIADIIKSMTLRGIKTAQSDARSLMEWAFDFAYTKYKYNRRNPAQINISIFLPNHKTTPFRHLVKKEDIKEMMVKIKNYTSSYSNIKVALELMPYVFLRPYNLASAKWEDIDFNKKLWVIPATEMKMRRDHSVPLTDRMIELIKSVEYNRKISPYLFKSHISSRGHIAPDSLTVVLRKLEINSTAHGMRHMASTLLRENAKIEGFSKEAIEYQLAHVEGGISGVYNHADYLGERFKIMQWWSDWLESLY
jgi:integrase